MSLRDRLRGLERSHPAAYVIALYASCEAALFAFLHFLGAMTR